MMALLMFKRIIAFHLFFIITGFIAVTVFLQDMFDLSDRNYREEFREQEVAGKEQTKRTHIETNLPDSWSIVSTP